MMTNRIYNWKEIKKTLLIQKSSSNRKLYSDCFYIVMQVFYKNDNNIKYKFEGERLQYSKGDNLNKILDTFHKSLDKRIIKDNILFIKSISDIPIEYQDILKFYYDK